MLRRALCFVSACLICFCAWGELPSTLFDQSGFVEGGYAGFSILPGDEPRRMEPIPDVVTPHIVWTKSLTSQPLRVLAIAHRHAGRWPVELLQRFDMHVEVVYGGDTGKAGPPHVGYIGQHAEDVQARVLQKMNQPLDVIISDISMSALGERVQERLQELLAGGVGYVGRLDGVEMGTREQNAQHEAALLASAAPDVGLRALNSDETATPVVTMWDDGASGRIADPWGYPRDDALPGPDRLQYPWLVSVEQEAWFSFLGRLTYWAARRLPARSTVSVAWPSEAIQREALPHALPISDTAPGETIPAIRVWDADGRPQHTGPGLSLPLLPAGRYFIGVQGLTGAGVTDWTFGTVAVCSEADIADVKLDKRQVGLDETVRADIQLAADPPDGSTLLMEVLDNFGRCVASKRIEASRQARFEASVRESLHMYNYVNVRLLDADGRAVAETRRSFFVAQPRPAPDDLSWVVWAGAPLHPRYRNHLRQLAGMGMAGVVNDAHHGATEKSRASVENAAISNAHSIMYVKQLFAGATFDDGVRKPCLTDPGYLNSLKRQLSKQAAFFAGYVPLAYTLGDDQRYVKGQDICWSPTCCAGLASFAKERYGTIGRLNEAWGTAYAGFEQVQPAKREEAIKAAQRTDNPDYSPLCRWVDRQLYADQIVTAWHAEMADALRVADPKQPVGFDCTNEGWQRPGSGFDFWQIAETLDLLGQYPSTIVHSVFRTARRPDAYHATWYGGYGIYTRWPYHDQHYQPWWYTFNGVNLHGLWGLTITRYVGERVLSPDLGPYHGPGICLDNIQELQRGIAKIIFNADRADDGVAILYSPASLHASAALPGLPRGPGWTRLDTGNPQFAYNRSWEGMALLLSDMGLSYGVIPAEHLKKGRLEERKLRLLVLPMALRLTDAEAAAIRRFVESGGTVMADVFPGLLDGTCRASHPGVLAEVFGVRFGGGIPDASRMVRAQASMRNEASLGEVTADTGVTLAGAAASGKTAAGTPIFTANKWGKGAAILLNTTADDYQIWRTLTTELHFRNAVEGMLSEEGITPAIQTRVVYRGGKETPLQATECFRYELDGAQYVGLLRDGKLRPDETVYMADQRPKPVWITFDRTAHVYDVREGVYRGYTDTINDMIYPARAKFYALMPYEVRGLSLSLERHGGEVHLSGQVVSGDAAVPLTTHVVHIEVTDPAGRRRLEYARNVLAENGRFRERFFLGHTPEPGAWGFAASDVASGMTRGIAGRVQSDW